MNNKKAKRGLSIVVVAMLIFVLSVLFFSLIMMVKSSLSFAGVYKRDQIALETARAGVNKALYNVSLDLNWQAGFNSESLPQLSDASYTMSFDKNQTVIPYSTSNILNDTAVTGYQGREIPAFSIHLISLGYFKEGVYTARRTVEALLQASRTNPWSWFSIFGYQSLHFNGNSSTDSFNSDLGTYEQTRSNSDGTIGTNAIETDTIQLNGNVIINGDAMVGVEGDPNTVIKETGNVIITGNRAPMSEVFPKPAVNPPTGNSLGDRHYSGKGELTLPPGIYDNIIISGNYTVILQPGNYVINRLQITGNSQLQLNSDQTQPTYIFVQDQLDDTGNGFVNQTGKSPLLQIYGTSTCQSVKVTGNAYGYYALYAPEAEVQIVGNGDVYGSVIGKTIHNTGNAQVHYDKALKNALIPPNLAGSIEFINLSLW